MKSSSSPNHEWLKTIPAGNAGAKVSMLMHVVAFIPVATLAVYHFMLGNWLVSGALGLMSLTLLVTVIGVRFAPSLCIHAVFDAAFILLALPTSLWTLFEPSMYVIYLIPALIFAAFFVLPIRISPPLLAAYTLAAVVLFASQHSLDETLRAGFGLGACYFFTLGLALVMLRQQRQLTELAFLDPLTGAYNRNALLDELVRVMDNTRRRDSYASVAMLDLDSFKQINDKYGHAAGDDVLVWLATQVMGHSRRNDRLFRLGGDEFLLLLPELEAKEAYRVIQLIKERLEPGGVPHQIRATVSAGVAQLSETDTVDSWLDKADKALYLAKSDGKNCCRSWRPELSDRQ